jgi:hypothetical protein
MKEQQAEIERLQLIIYERGEIYEHHRSCDLLNAEIERLRTERDTFEIELRRVRNGVDYWSYCMSEGMRKTCPEKVDELMDFLISLKIAPYYVRTTASKAGGDDE